MPVLTGTATDHVDLFDQLRAFLTTAGPTGPGWTELSNVGTSYIYEAPGLSGLEEIHVGLDYVESVSTDSFALLGWMFQDYNSLLGHLVQPGHSGVRYHPVWNTSMPFWFIANGQRCIVVTKVSTVYTASYFGKFLPYGAPGEYPQPYYLAMPTTGNNRWSSTNESTRNFFDPGSGGIFLTPTASWLSVSNFLESSSTETPQSSRNLFPFHADVGAVGNQTRDLYRALRENLDGSYNLRPLVILSSTPTTDVFGELDSAYAINAFSAASEDIIEIGGDDYLVVQNIFRTARYYYGAIKLT
jgi:hypothetical protein